MGMSSDYIMPFGKYKDEPLINIPRSYLKWLLEKEWIDKHKKLKEKIEEQLERRDSSHDEY
jgi:uncharacterized protein (DUF3820 family)